MPDFFRPSAVGDEWSDWGELLEEVRRAPSWHADALCREHRDVTWFPVKGEDPQPAKDICARCLVVFDCRAWAMAQPGDLQGIWGGLSHRERRALRRRDQPDAEAA